jgi:hypothetical protein
VLDAGRIRTTTIFAVMASLLSTVCSGDEAGVSDDPEDSIFVDDSKADDFFSLTAQEYLVEGKSTIVLDAAFATKTAAERLTEAKRIVGLKQIAIAWFMTQYLVDKEHDDPNASFGGFGGMAKAGAYEDLEIRERADKLTFDFTFRQIAAGGKNLTTTRSSSRSPSQGTSERPVARTPIAAARVTCVSRRAPARASSARRRAPSSARVAAAPVTRARRSLRRRAARSTVAPARRTELSLLH